MADELAPTSKLACFLRTLLCARGSVTCTSDQDFDFRVSSDSIAQSPTATKVVAARSQKSDPKWSNIVVNLSYTADKGTSNKCPTSLSPGAIGGEVDDYLYFPSSVSSAPPFLLPTIADHSPDPGQDMLWHSNNVSYFLAGAPSPQRGVRPSSMRKTSWEQSDRPASLKIQGANQQDKALGGTACQFLPVSPTFLPPRGGRQNTQASTLNASKQSPHVKGLLADQGARTLSKGQQGARGNGLDVQNLSSILSLDPSHARSPAYRRACTCHSMVHQGRPELGQGVSIRSQNSVTVDRRSDPLFKQLSVSTEDTSMRGGVYTSMRLGSALSSPGVCPHPQPWQRKSTLIPRLQGGRVGKYLELLKRNSAAAD
eukprot:gene23041-30236_t